MFESEEFPLILVETSQEQSFDIAERLREKIEQHTFELPPEALSRDSSQNKVHITVSIGLATYPKHADSKELFIANADRAMYIAKFSGKNRTCIAEEE